MSSTMTCSTDILSYNKFYALLYIKAGAVFFPCNLLYDSMLCKYLKSWVYCKPSTESRYVLCTPSVELPEAEGLEFAQGAIVTNGENLTSADPGNRLAL